MSQITAQMLIIAFLMVGHHILVIKGKHNRKVPECVKGEDYQVLVTGNVERIMIFTHVVV